MKFKMDDEVMIKSGFNRGRRGRLYAHVFWILYLLEMENSDESVTTLWFNIKHDALECRGEQDE